MTRLSALLIAALLLSGADICAGRELHFERSLITGHCFAQLAGVA